MSRLSDLATLADQVTDPDVLRDEELVVHLRELGQLRRLVDAHLAAAAGVVEGRCLTRGFDTPAARRGYRTPADLIEAETQLDRPTAAALVRVGAAVAPMVSLTGEVLPALHPRVADAVTSGALSVGAADRIVSTLDRVCPLTTPEQIEYLEDALVQVAPTLSSRDLRVACARVRDHIDPDGVEPTEEWLRQKATLTLTPLDNGLTRVSGYLHPEQFGFLTTALDARTAPRRTPTFTPDHPTAEAITNGSDAAAGNADNPPAADVADVVEDHRTLGQKRADALAGIARDSLTLDTGTIAGAPVAVLVTMTLDQLHGQSGAASIAGIEPPISAGTARRLAANADLIPLVLGGPSEILDQGRNQRLATPAQRRALTHRDQGCIWRCGTPPGWCEVAHLIAWILDGPTDLNSLALMCPFHHHLYDTQGWTLEWKEGTPWLIPPAHIDPHRTPRRAGPLPAIA